MRPFPFHTAHLLLILTLALGALALTPHVTRAASLWPADSTAAIPVCRMPGLIQAPLAVSDGAHGLIALWTDYRNGFTNVDLYARRVTALGDTLWSGNGSPVTTTFGNQQLPAATADGRGGVFVAWADMGLGGIYAQHLDATGSKRWATNGKVVSNSYTSTNGPLVCPDATGGLFVAWAPTSTTVLGQHLDSLGANWTFFPPTVVGVTLRTASSASARAIVSDGANGAIVAIGSNVSSNGVATVQRYDAARNVLWGVNGVDLCASPSLVVRAMVSDGAGGAIVAWDDTRNGASNADAFLQRVSPAGTPRWIANGVVASGAPGNQNGAVLRALPDGGVVVVWRDTRTNVQGDLYAQRFDSSGVALWAADGVPVATGITTAASYSIAEGAGDSTFVVWNSSALYVGDVFAQELDGAGQRLFGPAGTALCRGPAGQLQSFALADGLGGVYAVFDDMRYGDDDVAVQHIGANGLAGPGVLAVSEGPGPSRGATMYRAAPNPWRTGLRITLAAPRDVEGRVQVFDLAGRVRWAAPLARGARTFEWDGRGTNGARVEPGVYRIRVTRGAEAGTATVVRVE